MPRPECFEYCPYITVPAESLVVETQIPSSSDRERVAGQIDELVAGAAKVAISACEGPEVVEAVVQKNGYFESKKPVRRAVYRCGADGRVQLAAFYYQKDKMPNQA